MKLFILIDDVVLSQDASNCLIASIIFYDCYKGSIKLGEDRSCQECYFKVVKGLLLCMSTSNRNIFCQVDQIVCLSTVIDNQLMVIISKA